MGVQSNFNFNLCRISDKHRFASSFTPPFSHREIRRKSWCRGNGMKGSTQYWWERADGAKIDFRIVCTRLKLFQNHFSSDGTCDADCVRVCVCACSDAHSERSNTLCELWRPATEELFNCCQWNYNVGYIESSVNKTQWDRNQSIKVAAASSRMTRREVRNATRKIKTENHNNSSALPISHTWKRRHCCESDLARCAFNANAHCALHAVKRTLETQSDVAR